MTTEYRMLEPWEPVQKGDEFYYTGKWRPSGNYVYSPFAQDKGSQYRRPLPAAPAFVPQWKHPDAPGVPVHVLWAESPSTVRTVAQVAAEAKPNASVNPGVGYRLLGPDEIIEKGDQWNNGNTCWSLATGSIGKKAGSIALVFRRKLPVPEPQYRPYANAAEAAAGLQGKLIVEPGSKRTPGCYYSVGSITPYAVGVGSNWLSFSALRHHWKFTDGTPCGVLVTSEKGAK